MEDYQCNFLDYSNSSIILIKSTSSIKIAHSIDTFCNSLKTSCFCKTPYIDSFISQHSSLAHQSPYFHSSKNPHALTLTNLSFHPLFHLPPCSHLPILFPPLHPPPPIHPFPFSPGDIQQIGNYHSPPLVLQVL